MKKLIACVLALVMCLSVFAGCNSGNTPETSAPETTAPAGPSAADGLENAKAYLRTMYKDKVGKVLRDFDLVSQVKIGEFTYSIEWTTDAAAENVSISAPADNKVTVDVNENPGEEDLIFKLTATLTADGKSVSADFDFYVPGTPASSGGPPSWKFPRLAAPTSTLWFRLSWARLCTSPAL